MITVLLATRNPKKAKELRQLVRGMPVRFVSLNRFPDIPPVREDGATFRANAVKKAVETSRHTILPVLADDSGLEVQALSGCPGVRSARFAGTAQNDRANIDKLLRAMTGVPDSKRGARFVCCLAFAVDGRLVRVFEGVCDGKIASEPAGRTGFGYDPVFLPRGRRKTLAQLSSAQKNRLSHRFRAVSKFQEWIRTGL